MHNIKFRDISCLCVIYLNNMIRIVQSTNERSLDPGQANIARLYEGISASSLEGWGGQ